MMVPGDNRELKITELEVYGKRAKGVTEVAHMEWILQTDLQSHAGSTGQDCDSIF